MCWVCERRMTSETSADQTWFKQFLTFRGSDVCLYDSPPVKDNSHTATTSNVSLVLHLKCLYKRFQRKMDRYRYIQLFRDQRKLSLHVICLFSYDYVYRLLFTLPGKRQELEKIPSQLQNIRVHVSNTQGTSSQSAVWHCVLTSQPRCHLGALYMSLVTLAYTSTLCLLFD